MSIHSEMRRKARQAKRSTEAHARYLANEASAAKARDAESDRLASTMSEAFAAEESVENGFEYPFG